LQWHETLLARKLLLTVLGRLELHASALPHGQRNKGKDGISCDASQPLASFLQNFPVLMIPFHHVKKQVVYHFCDGMVTYPGGEGLSLHECKLLATCHKALKYLQNCSCYLQGIPDVLQSVVKFMLDLQVYFSVSLRIVK
jgi:hypothetical protein